MVPWIYMLKKHRPATATAIGFVFWTAIFWLIFDNLALGLALGLVLGGTAGVVTRESLKPSSEPDEPTQDADPES